MEKRVGHTSRQTTSNHRANLGVMTPERFLGLAVRCRFRVNQELLTRLAQEGWVLPLEWKGAEGYLPVHLWLLARYFDAVCVDVHPWEDAPSASPNRDEELRALSEDARRLHGALSQWIEGGSGRAFSALSPKIQSFVEDRSLVGGLSALMPLLSASARSGLRGEVLLGELLADFVRKMSAEAQIPAAAEVQRPVAAEAQGYAVEESDGDSESVDIVVEEPEEEPVSSASDLREKSDPEVGARAPLRRQRGSLKETLARVRASKSRGQEADREEEKSEAPASVPEKPKRSVRASLEEQVQELNERREEYIQNENWQALVDLYTERIYLFPQPEDRRQIFLNIGVIYEQKLDDDARAIGAYYKAFETDPGHAIAFDGLVRLYQKGARWDDLLAILDWMIEVSSPERRVSLIIQRSLLLARELGQADVALATCKEWLRSDLSQPQRAQILQALRRIALQSDASGEVLLSVAATLEAHWGAEESTESLLALYQGLHANLLSRDPEAAAEAISRAASVQQGGGDLAGAFDTLSKAFAFNPEDDGVRARLEALAARLDRREDLAEVYEDELERVEDEELRAALGRRLAALFAELGHVEGERRAWAAVQEAEPRSLESTQKLVDLHEKSGDLQGLLEVLIELAEIVDQEERAEIYLRVARMRSEGVLDADSPMVDLVDLDGAIGALQEALSLAGEEVRARVVSFALQLAGAGSHTLGFQVVTLLEQVQSLNEDYTQELMEAYEVVVESHLLGEEHRREACRILLKVGDLQRDHFEHQELAFSYYARALRADPGSSECLDRLESMAENHDRWKELAALYDELLEEVEEGERAEWLLRVARVYRLRLQDLHAAYPRYDAIYRRTPDNEEALAFLEDYHREQKNWSGLVDILEGRVEGAREVAAQRALLSEAASIYLEELGEEEKALSILRKLLMIDPEDQSLLGRLLVLCRGAGRFDEMLEVLERQADLAQDPARKAAILRRRVSVLEHDLGRRPEALLALERLCREAPGDLEALQALEALYLGEERAAEAFETRERITGILEANKNSPEGLLRWMESAEKLAEAAEDSLNDPDLATFWYQRVLEHNPEHLGALAGLEQIYEDREEWGDLSRVLLQHARVMAAQEARGAALVLLERYVEVIQTHSPDDPRELDGLRLIIKLREEPDIGTLERLMDAARQHGQWALCLQSSEAYLGLLEEPVDHVMVLREMAQVAGAELGDNHAALGYLERAYDAHPSDPVVLKELAVCLRKGAHQRRLVEVLRLLLEAEGGVSPEQRVNTCRELAELLDKHLGEPRQAAGILERSLGVIREYGEVISPTLRQGVRRRLIDLYRSLGEADAGFGHLEELLEEMSRTGAPGAHLAGICKEMGRLQEELGDMHLAERHYFNAVSEDEGNPLTRMDLALFYVRQRRWDEALGLLEDLREQDRIQDPGEKGRLFAALGRVLGATNKVGRAMEAYRLSLEFDPNNQEAREAING